jgi:thiamine-monophosphate kinase
VRLELDLDALPLAPGVAAVAAALSTDPQVLAATGGEDFELCACMPDAAAAAVPGLTRVGRVIAGEPDVVFSRAGAVLPGLAGYEHRLG